MTKDSTTISHSLRYYRENSERLKKMNRDWKNANKKKVLAYNKKYYEDHKEEHGERRREASRRRRKELKIWLNQFRKECSECGESDVSLLDFHHLDPSEKLGEVTTLIISRGKAVARREMMKCIVLCKTCHKKKHRSKTRKPKTIECPHCNKEFII